MSFEFIELRNFKQHTKLRVELDRNVTTIAGENNSGKTTVLQCIEWICQNNLRGDSFTKWGEKQVTGILGVDENEVKRTKGEAGNHHILNGEKFSRDVSGAKIPEQIAKLLNTHPCSFQDQHEALYWLSRSPGQIGKSLNEIIDLEIIDKSLANAQRETRKCQNIVDLTNQRLRVATEHRSQLKWVKELDTKLTKVEELEKKRIQLSQELLGLSSLLKRAKGLTKRIKVACTTFQDSSQKVSELRELITKRAEIVSIIEECNHTLRYYKSLRLKCKTSQKKLELLQASFLAAKRKLTQCPLCQQPIQSAVLK